MVALAGLLGCPPTAPPPGRRCTRHGRVRETERVEIAFAGRRGRTGTALACLAVLDGVPGREAVAYVRKRCASRAVETPWQRRFVTRFQQWSFASSIAASSHRAGPANTFPVTDAGAGVFNGSSGHDQAILRGWENRRGCDRHRVPPPFIGDERAMLNSWLDWHRKTLAVKCAGLSEEQLRERFVPPSTMSLLGLVRHMAHVERAWFRHVLNDEDVPLLYKTDDPDAEFNDVDTASTQEALCHLAGGGTSMPESSRRRCRWTPLESGSATGRSCSHRWILVHMIEEYARHNGHADLLRQRIDGVTGE